MWALLLLLGASYDAGDSLAGARLGHALGPTWSCDDGRCVIATRWEGLRVRGHAEVRYGTVRRASVVATFVDDADVSLLPDGLEALHAQRADDPAAEARSWARAYEDELDRDGWERAPIAATTALQGIHESGHQSRWERHGTCLQVGAWPVELVAPKHQTLHLAQVVLDASPTPCRGERR